MCSKYPGSALEIGRHIENMRPSAHVVHRTEKQIISRRWNDEDSCQIKKKMKNACMCKITVFLG